MCLDPISLSLLTLGAGTAASYAGSQIASNEAAASAAAEVRARNLEKQKTDARLREFEDENRAKFSDLLKDQWSTENQAATKDAAVATREQAIEETITPTESLETGAPLTEGAPQIIKGNVAKRLRDAFESATENAKLQAAPEAYGDVLAMNKIALTDTGRYLDTVNSFAKQEAALLPAAQDLAAYSATKTPSGWGPLLKAGGKTAAAVGGSGYLRPAAAAPAATASAILPSTVQWPY